MWLAELFAELLLIIEDLKFWKKKKARRKYEKENGLPKKTMWLYPSDKIVILAFFVVFVIAIIVYFMFFRNMNENRTVEKLVAIEKLLEAEKKQFGVYPEELNTILRNNPMHRNLLFDSWDNSFLYELSEDNLTYCVISMGKDGKFQTNDDIKLDK